MVILAAVTAIIELHSKMKDAEVVNNDMRYTITKQRETFRPLNGW